MKTVLEILTELDKMYCVIRLPDDQWCMGYEEAVREVKQFIMSGEQRCHECHDVIKNPNHHVCDDK